MIDAYFDSENEFRELMNMMDNRTEEEIIDKFETEIISQNKIRELEEENDLISEEISKLRGENDEVVAENSHLKAKIRELEEQLNSK